MACAAGRISQCPDCVRVGGFAERVALPARNVHALPRGLDPVTAALYPYDRLDEFFALAPLQQDPPLESDQYVTRQRVLAAWQEVKSAG